MKLVIALNILFVLLSSSVFAQADDRTKYLGFEYKGVSPPAILSNGVEYLGGGLIGDIDANPVYGISQVEQGSTKMLWFEKSTGRNSGGITGWKVIDLLSFHNMAEGEYLFFEGVPEILCKRSGKAIRNLVGIGRVFRAKGIFQPSKLWVANLRIKRFEPLPTTKVKCEYSEP